MTMWIPIRKVKLEDGDLKNGILHKQANIYIFSYMHARWAKVIRRDVFPIICYSKEERRRGRKEGREGESKLITDVIKCTPF